MKKAAIHTLGCKVNQYESEAMAELLQQDGYEIVPFDSTADCYLINTCTVTSLSDRKSRQMIRRAKKRNPEALLVVTGCYAQTAPEEIQKIPEVDLIIGTSRRNELPQLIREAQHKQLCAVEDIMKQTEFETLHIASCSSNRVRAFLKVQDGCDRYCSYCMIPYARGHVRSRPLRYVLEEIKRLAEKGVLEIVLSGIHVASYGRDLEGETLLTLVQRAHEIPGIQRIRLGSLEPNCVTEEFASALARLPKFCPQFHLSLQSGCDNTLKRMNRHYTAREYEEGVSLLRRYFPGAGITTDVMVGFAGETQEDFAESMRFVEKIGFSQLHVFPYSIRKGTKAASFPDQIAPQVKEQRAAAMIALGNRLTREFIASKNGTAAKVLVEQQISPGLYQGYTPEYVRVHIPSRQDITGQLITVSLHSPQEEFIYGQR